MNSQNGFLKQKFEIIFSIPLRGHEIFLSLFFLLILESEGAQIPVSKQYLISLKQKSGRVVSVQLTFTLPDSINCFDRCLEILNTAEITLSSRKELIVVRSSCQPSFGIKICV